LTTDYKDTLNLPETAFAMKANLAQREPEQLARWQAADVYGQIRAARKDAPRFVFADGPPYANGDIHIGHAVNKVLKDIVVKSRTLMGYDAQFVPGWDCHGLPIELQVEKKHGKPGQKLDAQAFRKACRAYAAEQVDRQRQDFIRLGVLADWHKPYLTMDFKYEADQLRALGRMIANGHLYKGLKPVHWCLDCGSALAEAEVEYEDKTSPSIDVRYAVDADDIAHGTFFGRFTELQRHADLPVSVAIWTTTPWTLPASMAVCVHPEFEYALIEIDAGRGPEFVLVARELVAAVVARWGATLVRTVGHATGQALAGVQLRHPFYDRVLPIVVGDHVTLDSGTGLVHTAPGHGQEDFAVGQANGLEVLNPVGPNGVFLETAPGFAGQHVFKANDAIIALCAERGALLASTKVQHSYPHCWRHKTPVIFRATPQWFLSMDQNGLRAAALAAIPKVRWVPGWGEERIRGMIQNRPDWCISRQRTWGVPIPLFVDKVTGALHPRTPELIETVARKVEQAGIEAWFDLTAEDLVGADAVRYDKVPDTLDVWFDSGVVHWSVLEQRPGLGVPADLYLEGSDQHRGWFQSSLLTSVAIRGTAPYKDVLTHGFTVDAQGRKMSKSLGNVVAPQQVMSTLGADVLRLWVAATDYSGEISVSDEILKRVADTYRRLRNTTRFLLANLDGFDPARDQLPLDELVALDRWVLERARTLQESVVGAYQAYEFHRVYHEVHNFCVVDLGSFYLDVIKDRQYTTPRDSRARRSAQTALYHVAEAMTRWLAPILSFTAEEVWQHLPGERGPTVFTADLWGFPTGRDHAAAIDWDSVLAVRQVVARELEKQRNEKKLGASLEAEVDLWVEPVLAAKLAVLGDELRFALITSRASVHAAEARPADALSDAALPGLWLRATASTHPKCVRCWHRRPDVGADSAHPELCGRCVTNLAMPGETRRFA
jgi:isoleucyl-tRNA synthetase